MIRTVRLFSACHITSIKVARKCDGTVSPFELSRYPLRMMLSQFFSGAIAHNTLDPRPPLPMAFIIIGIAFRIAIVLRVKIVFLFL